MLRNRVTCPHCWKSFAPEDSVWIAQHSDLLGDPQLGPDAYRRFLPSRFTPDGAALDAKGFPCRQLACPHCNLEVPRDLLSMSSIFVSVLGSPACGKSYFLAACVNALRRNMAGRFGFSFLDSDAEMNRQIREYEDLQFVSNSPERLAYIRKTEEQAALYNSVLFNGEPVRLPHPFLFSMRPLAQHPNSQAGGRMSKVLCLYDNAGESFLPGADTASAPVTRHLARSNALFYLFDPCQDARFRQACQGRSADPQMHAQGSRLASASATRQEVVLVEAINRLRRHANLLPDELARQPIYVIVTKYDAWSSLLGGRALPDAVFRQGAKPVASLDANLVESTSQQVRELLRQYSPEIVAAAESSAKSVVYIPISSLGRAPEQDKTTGALGIRPKDISPQWVDVPFLYFLSQSYPGMIAISRSARQDASSGPASPHSTDFSIRLSNARRA